MQIQVNTDNNIEGGEELSQQVEGVVEGTLGRFAERLTRVEVHLTDESGSAKSYGNDIRCAMEARPRGLQPIAVTHEAPTLEQAVDGAADKLAKTLDRKLGRLDDAQGRTSYSGDPT